MRLLGGIALAALLAGCANTIVPRGVDNGSGAQGVPVVSRPPARPGDGGLSRESGVPRDAARQPVAAIPMAPVAVTVAAGVATGAAAGVVPGPTIDRLPFDAASAARALDSFRTSCSSLVRRTDASGLTRGADWQPACDAARSAGARDASAFFARWFEAAQVGDGKAFATGYYEPEIAGSRRRQAGYDVPVYAKPADLVEVDLSLFSTEMAGRRIRGRVEAGAFVPYFDRTAIERGALADRDLEIGWAADAIELFFLQVQGSGRLRLPDGQVMRIGYAGQNGRDYTGIGKLMRDRGLLAPGQASMQGIIAWLRANPAEGQEIMRENRSYVFFRELTGPGPLGAMGHPVVGRTSVATDPAFVPLGAPVFLSMDRQDATGLWIAQDTGGAIKGSNRFDTFWGAGEDARATAGGMSARGTAFVLLPRGTLARLAAGRTGGGRTTP